MLWHSLTRSLSNLMVRLRITGQKGDGNSAASENTDHRHGRIFIVSIIFILYRLPIMLSHKALTMNQYSTGGWDIPPRSVTAWSLVYRNKRPDTWRRPTSLVLNYPRQFLKIMSLIRIMVTHCGPIQSPKRWRMQIFHLISCLMESVCRMVTRRFLPHDIWRDNGRLQTQGDTCSWWAYDQKSQLTDLL